MSVFERIMEWISTPFTGYHNKQAYDAYTEMKNRHYEDAVRRQQEEYAKGMQNMGILDYTRMNASSMAQSKAATDILEFRLGKIEALNRDIKNLQISIFLAKKRKKKTSHFYAEMARIQAEVLRLEAM